MDLQLEGKVAIVTGASRGIGSAIAKTLAAEGARLVLAARSREQLDLLAESLPTECLVQPVDLLSPDAAGAVTAAALERFGQVDVLINNAGATKRGDFLTLTDSDWEDGFGLKFFGTMRLCRAAWPHLRDRRGAIVNIAGVGGRTGDEEFTIGGSVNSAVMYLTKALSDRGVREGVRVNAVNPGATLTERLQVRIRKRASDMALDEPEAVRQMTSELGIARFATPEEIATVVAFLASPLSGHCQGAIMDVDGGQTRGL